MPPDVWNTSEASANNYGYEIAKHFRTVHGNGLVVAVDVGNKPLDNEDSFYATVLRGMTSGIKNADPQMGIVADTVQAADETAIGKY